MVKKFYEAPELELIRLTVEAGFAASLTEGSEGSGDSGGADSGWEEPL